MNFSQQMLWLLTILLCAFLFGLQSVAQSCDSTNALLVAVVDTGADLSHKDLKDWIWTNPGESGIDSSGNDKASNHIDDDDNGFVDDLHGWNFVQNNSDVMDHHGHGTHVSGLISKHWPPSLAKKSCPVIQLMVIKYFDQRFTENDTLDSSIKSFRYAINNGAKIINFSGGGAKKFKIEENAIRLALQKEILLVAAAGNEGANSDKFKFYPAGYMLPNILSVSALDKGNRLLSSSNYGLKTVKLATVGENLNSSLPGGIYGPMTGTSQATAVTTGIAALILHKNPWLDTPQKIIERLVRTAKKNPSLALKIGNLTQLNILKSLRSADRHTSAFGKKIENAIFIPERMFLDNNFTADTAKIPNGI